MGTSKSGVILLSRQHLRPSLRNRWVQNLGSAAPHVKQNGWTLNSSVGTSNWEIITSCAALLKVPVKVFLTELSNQIRNEVIAEFNLDGTNVEFEKPGLIAGKSDIEAKWRARDQAVVESADILIPISIRPGGHLAKLLESAKIAGKQIIHDFQTQYEKSAPSLSYTINQNDLSNKIRQIKDEYIIHWTRASNAPWPNETKFDYYSSVLNSESYPRSALDTLQRIVESELILGSIRNMPGKTPTVSFSGLAPSETIKLIKWRARYNQMSFEPYGIGIEKSTALSSGIDEVVYFDPRKENIPANAENWLTQSFGRITDWRNEKEFRHFGDFDISKIPPEKLILFCRFQSEASALQDKLKIKTFWFCD